MSNKPAKMTDKEKKNYERYFKELVNGAIYKYPAFGNLVTYIPRRILIDDSFPNEVAGTDGKSLRLFPKFFTEFTGEEQAFILLHEVLHVVQSHPQRANQLIETEDRVLWNIVTDCIINFALGYGNDNQTQDLKDLKVPRLIVGYPELSKLVGEDVPVVRDQNGTKKDWDAEGLYRYVKGKINNSKDKEDIEDALDKLGKGKPQSMSVGNRNFSEKEFKQISGAIGDLSQEDFNDPLPEHLKDEELPTGGGDGAISDIIWSKRVEQAAGRDPSGILKGILGDLPKPKPDWRKELRTYIGNKLLPQPKTNWRRPSRRTLSGVVDHFEPARGRERGCKRILCFHDTSGSCWDFDTIKEFISNIQSIQDIKKAHVTYIMFDAEIQKVTEVPYSNSRKLIDLFRDTLKAQGGGGTSFYPIVDWINSYGKEADVAVILTDTYAPMPSTKPPIPIVWAVISNQDFIPPFGKSVFIEEPPQGY